MRATCKDGGVGRGGGVITEGERVKNGGKGKGEDIGGDEERHFDMVRGFFD